MKLRSLALLVCVEIAILIIRFLIGIALILYVNIPVAFATGPYLMPGSILVYAHAVIGVIALLVAVFLAYESRRFTLLKLIRRSMVFGMVWVLIGEIFGAGYLYYGSNSIFAWLMSAAFVAAIVCYTVAAAFFMTSA